MLKSLNREIYLWQGILIFMIIIGVVVGIGLHYTKKSIELNSEPISKIDREMVSLQKSVRKKPNANEYSRLGAIYLQKGATSEAKKAYYKVLKLEANQVDALYNLGLIYIDEKDFSKAQEFFERAIKIEPKHPYINLHLAKVYIEVEHYEKAEELLAKVEKYFSATADYYYYRGLVNEKLDKKSTAANYFEKALSFDPEYRDAQAGLSRVKS